MSLSKEDKRYLGRVLDIVIFFVITLGIPSILGSMFGRAGWLTFTFSWLIGAAVVSYLRE